MKIMLTNEAIEWFEKNFPLDEGEAVRFFGKTYGKTNVHDGFSVGIELDNPQENDSIIGITEINNRTYFVTKEDEWFFNQYDLSIDLDNQFNEPAYHFELQQ